LDVIEGYFGYLCNMVIRRKIILTSKHYKKVFGKKGEQEVISKVE